MASNVCELGKTDDKTVMLSDSCIVIQAFYINIVSETWHFINAVIFVIIIIFMDYCFYYDFYGIYVTIA